MVLIEEKRNTAFVKGPLACKVNEINLHGDVEISKAHIIRISAE